MAKSYTIDHADFSILILSNIVSVKLAELVSPRTLDNRRNVVLLALVIVKVISHLSQGLISTTHNGLIDFIEKSGVCLSKLTALRMNCSSYHNNLRVKSHVKGMAQIHSPLKRSLEIVLKRFVDYLLHDILSLHSFILVRNNNISNMLINMILKEAAYVATFGLTVAVIARLTKNRRSGDHLQSLNRSENIRVTTHEVSDGLVKTKIILFLHFRNCIRQLAHCFISPII